MSTDIASTSAGNDDICAVPYLRQGQLISLVHWSCEHGDWHYSTLLAEYHHRDEGTWYVRLRGEETQLRRAEWALFT
ncbi:hypothetical protein P5G50_10520 [Leifsonia sp. F6_8S_P_1B]|uniref:DUF5348 domain-containing protein n=1 Tax=Leifsonia williamsii TaxID=3035919 RepID=A0ABT8KBS0_9MICO|nr:hypothetical protein [Leifsonia williamsii]MDN4614885.1 hypothetical protein [Leifsonia williamsii]